MDKEFKELFDKEVEAVKLFLDARNISKYKNAVGISVHAHILQVGDVRATAKLLDMSDEVKFRNAGGRYPIEMYFNYNGVEVFSLYDIFELTEEEFSKFKKMANTEEEEELM
jgi:hypothetical protein